MLVLVTLMIASVGSLITGSGTVSTDTFRRPCHVTARMRILLDVVSSQDVPNCEVAKPLANSSCPRASTRQDECMADRPTVVESRVHGASGTSTTVGNTEAARPAQQQG